MKAQRRKVLAMPQRITATNFGKEAIEQIAEQAARALGYKPPEGRSLSMNAGGSSDLRALVASIGGTVLTKEFWKIDGTNDESIRVAPNGEFKIFIPPHTTPERDRFTMAHELGHYVLHYALDDNRKGEEFTASRYGDTPVEREANWFAAAFLMPRKKFEREFSSGTRDFGRIARYFGVSPRAAYVRAKSLGVVAPEKPDRA